uniref:Uncharacterized protein n=1 Tax=Meloidogyne hapla TaxID=6305 RepID=A0A1I8BQM1_MELHA
MKIIILILHSLIFALLLSFINSAPKNKGKGIATSSDNIIDNDGKKLNIETEIFNEALKNLQKENNCEEIIKKVVRPSVEVQKDLLEDYLKNDEFSEAWSLVKYGKPSKPILDRIGDNMQLKIALIQGLIVLYKFGEISSINFGINSEFVQVAMAANGINLYKNAGGNIKKSEDTKAYNKLSENIKENLGFYQMEEKLIGESISRIYKFYSDLNQLKMEYKQKEIEEELRQKNKGLEHDLNFLPIEAPEEEKEKEKKKKQWDDYVADILGKKPKY